jgi:hypothetical protein
MAQRRFFSQPGGDGFALFRGLLFALGGLFLYLDYRGIAVPLGWS